MDRSPTRRFGMSDAFGLTRILRPGKMVGGENVLRVVQGDIHGLLRVPL